jgi:MinD-like ATPase involved in chromosome partitioning or flagellar assembly
LSWPVSVAVPSDSNVMAVALNQGQPIVTRDRNHPISKSIVKLARQLDTSLNSASPQLNSGEAASSSPTARSGGFSLMRLKSGAATSP